MTLKNNHVESLYLVIKTLFQYEKALAYDLKINGEIVNICITHPYTKFSKSYGLRLVDIYNDKDSNPQVEELLKDYFAATIKNIDPAAETSFSCISITADFTLRGIKIRNSVDQVLTAMNGPIMEIWDGLLAMGYKPHKFEGYRQHLSVDNWYVDCIWGIELSKDGKRIYFKTPQQLLDYVGPKLPGLTYD